MWDQFDLLCLKNFKRGGRCYLENHPNCSYDFLEIYNGDAITDADHNLLQRFCSSVTPPPVTSSGYIATVHFHSDESLSDTGFSIAWAAVPGKK